VIIHRITGIQAEFLMGDLDTRIVIGLLIKGLTMFLIVVIPKVLKQQNNQKDALFSSKLLLAYFLLCLMAMFILFELIISNRENVPATNTWLLLIYMASFFLIIILLNRFYEIKSENINMKQSLLIHTLWQQNEILKVENNIEKLKRTHDLRNHLISLRNFIDTDQIQEAKNYLDIIDMHPILNEYVQTKNDTINAILNTKIAQNTNIHFSIRVNVDLFPIKVDDLTVLLGNALDNSIEAINKTQNNEKVIQVTISEGKQFCKIAIMNQYIGFLDIRYDILYSSKNSGYIGFGMINMRKIVNKYQGKLKYSFQNNEFKLAIILKK
jgi:sensor histidine kinase YesM